jgi:hypothetical protein
MQHIDENKQLLLEEDALKGAFKESGLINENIPSKAVEIKDL